MQEINFEKYISKKTRQHTKFNISMWVNSYRVLLIHFNNVFELIGL